jgi:hypothetical protein
MKQPDDSPIGGARKTLPTRKAHKIPRTARPGLVKKADRKNISYKETEREWVKIFDEK